MSMNALVDRVRKVILDNRYLSMATTDGLSSWIAPLAYSVEPEYSFVYYSSKDALHSQHVLKNPQVSCAIFNSSLSSDEVDGIQFSAKVSQIPIEELIAVVPAYFKQSFPVEQIRKRWKQPIDNFISLTNKRFYRIEPLDMYTIDLEYAKEDRRVEVSLQALREVKMVK